MSIAEDLKKLADLRRSGALTPEEFSLAKHQLLSGAGSSTPVPSPEGRGLGQAVDRYTDFQILWSIVGVVIFLIFLFGFVLPTLPSNHSPQIQFNLKPSSTPGRP